MSFYVYKAMDATGKITRGHLAAATLSDLEQRLGHMGLDLIRARPRSPHRYGTRPVNRRDLIEFCFHLEQLIAAGVPIIDALLDLRDSIENSRFRDVVAEIAGDIETGANLSQAMTKHPVLFDSVFVNLVAAGEHAGKLPEVLRELTESLKWQDEISAQTQRLILYPVFLGTLVCAVFIFLLVYLVPRIAGFLLQQHQTLPLNARILLALSHFFVQYWIALAALLPLLAMGSLLLARTQPKRWDSAKLRIPLLGKVLHKIFLARLASILALMYGAGIPIIEALQAASGTLSNRVLRDALQLVERCIRNGESIALAFESARLFPPLVIRMIRVGENTGHLDTALKNVAYFYSRDAKESVARMQVLLEPVLTVLIGALLGWIMLAVLGPIYDTIATLKI